MSCNKIVSNVNYIFIAKCTRHIEWISAAFCACKFKMKSYLNVQKTSTTQGLNLRRFVVASSIAHARSDGGTEYPVEGHLGYTGCTTLGLHTCKTKEH